MAHYCYQNSTPMFDIGTRVKVWFIDIVMVATRLSAMFDSESRIENIRIPKIKSARHLTKPTPPKICSKVRVTPQNLKFPVS